MSNQSGSMHEVNIDRLSRRMGKYGLVVAIAQRARELKERQARIGDLHPSNLIGRSLREIAEGKVKIIDSDEE